MSSQATISYKMNPSVRLRKEEFGGLVARPGTIDIFLLNPVGYEILNLCRRQAVNVAKVVSHVTTKYFTTVEQAENDAVGFLEAAANGSILIRQEDMHHAA